MQAESKRSLKWYGASQDDREEAWLEACPASAASTWRRSVPLASTRSALVRPDRWSIGWATGISRGRRSPATCSCSRMPAGSDRRRVWLPPK